MMAARRILGLSRILQTAPPLSFTYRAQSSAMTDPSSPVVQAGVYAGKGSLVGYETSPLLDADTDNALLEKSIRQGCCTVMVHSRTADAGHDQTYELLSDLWATEEVDLDHFSITHCLAATTATGGKSSLNAAGSPNSEAETVTQWRNELSNISATLRHKQPDFVCLTAGAAGPEALAGLSEQIVGLHAVVTEIAAASKKGNKPSQLGLHLPSSLLAAMSEEQSLHLKAYLQASAQAGTFGLYSIATNCLTHTTAAKIRSWLADSAAMHEQDMPLVLASETLRLNATRPGLLATPSHFSTQRKAVNTTICADPKNAEDAEAHEGMSEEKAARKGDALKATMDAAVEEFKISMDRCLHIEKKYIEDIAPTVPQIPLTDICWGHVLMHTHETFTAPEEWEYALRTAVLPKLDNALAILKKQDKKCSEYTIVYHGLVRNLFSVFLYLHQTRRLQLCSEALEAFRSSSSEGGGGAGGVENTILARVLAAADASAQPKNTLLAALERCGQAGSVVTALCARAVQADMAAVPGTEIAFHKWERVARAAQQWQPEEAAALLQQAVAPVVNRYN